MTVIADLDRCDYLPVPSDNLLAIGWLGRESQYRTGHSQVEFVEKLHQLMVNPWQPVASAGPHFCDLCQFGGQGSSKLLFVPYKRNIFVAPEVIVHYVETHWYQPPLEFVEGVQQCPKMNSMAYKKAILENGGRLLVQTIGVRGAGAT